MAIVSEECFLKGFPICRGIAIGKPFFFIFPEDKVPEFSILEVDLDAEVLRYQKAIDAGLLELRRLQKQLQAERVLEGAAILEGQLQMMLDPLLTTHIETTIRATRKNAEWVFQGVVKEFQKKFNSMSDPFFRERYKDVQDISRRVIAHLRQTVRVSLAHIPPHSIIFAKDLSASEAAEAQTDNVNAFVCEIGSLTSHAAIVAKAKGIPFVASIAFASIEPNLDRTVIVDGRTGDVIISPTEETLAYYRQQQQQLDDHYHTLEKVGTLSAETYDGYTVKLSANVEMIEEIDLLHKYGGDGVGLFRSEYTCIARETFPSEEEQFNIYRDLVERMKGLPVVIRTFDIGGDKFLLGQAQAVEENPFLGCRAIRLMLKEKESFKEQLRAILKASCYGNVKVMFPMVSSLSELLEAKKLIAEAREELESRGNAVPDIPIGCMVEVPSAAILCDLLVKECDFLSIGTNDLVQYALAADRGNHTLSGLYTPAHPSVLRLIKLILIAAQRKGISVSICGEVAADPRFTPLLIGLGVHELSVAPRYIPIVKSAIRRTSVIEAAKFAEKALLLSDAEAVEQLLNETYQQNSPEDFLYNF